MMIDNTWTKRIRVWRPRVDAVRIRGRPPTRFLMNAAQDRDL